MGRPQATRTLAGDRASALDADDGPIVAVEPAEARVDPAVPLSMRGPPGRPRGNALPRRQQAVSTSCALVRR